MKSIKQTKKNQFINVLKAYSFNLQSQHYDHHQERAPKPHTKSLKKDDRAMKARDNLRRPYLKEEKNNG